MAEVPLIGQNISTTEVSDFDSLSPEEQEALARMAEENPDDLSVSAESVSTAFMVIQHRDGQVEVNPDVTRQVAPDRVATPDDVIALGTVAVSDATSAKTAQATAFHMAQVGQMMQRQMAEQAEAARIQAMMAKNQAAGFKNR